MNWVIMPFVDNWDLTYQAAQDVLTQTLPDVHLLLIDNGSRDRSVQQQLGDRVLLWQHDPPLPSLSCTWNRALEFVWAVGGEQALVVNNDVRLCVDTYHRLKTILEAERAWFVSGVGVQEEAFDLFVQQGMPTARQLNDQRGGPDFSCYVISKACHRWFQFDEGFAPAYFEDNDYHRRIQLAGFGHRIFGVNLPFLHYGSRTINRSPEIARAFAPMFDACKQYYLRKWGGLPGQETFQYPFDLKAQRGGVVDIREVYLAQGWGFNQSPFTAEQVLQLYPPQPVQEA